MLRARQRTHAVPHGGEAVASLLFSADQCPVKGHSCGLTAAATRTRTRVPMHAREAGRSRLTASQMSDCTAELPAADPMRPTHHRVRDRLPTVYGSSPAYICSSRGSSQPHHMREGRLPELVCDSFQR